MAPQAEALRVLPTNPDQLTNTEALGRVMYTDYAYVFQAAGLVLLVAMIGAIVLTLRDRTSSRHQSIAAQLARTPADTMELLDVPSGVGTKGIGFLRPKVKEPAKVAQDNHGHIGHDNHGGHH